MGFSSFLSSVANTFDPVGSYIAKLGGELTDPANVYGDGETLLGMSVQVTLESRPGISSISPWDLNNDGVNDAFDINKIFVTLGIDPEEELSEKDIEKYEKFVGNVTALNVGSDYLSTLGGDTLEQFISAYGGSSEINKDSLLGILNDDNATTGAKKIAVALLNDFDDFNTTTTMQASLSADEIRGSASASASAGGIPASTEPQIASAVSTVGLIRLINQAAGLGNQKYLTSASLTQAIDSGLLSAEDQENAETIRDNFADLDNGNGNLFSREMDSLKLF